MVKMKLHKIGPLHSTITRVFNQNILIMTPWDTCATEAEVELNVGRFPQIKISCDQISITMLKLKGRCMYCRYLEPLTMFQDLHNALNRTAKLVSRKMYTDLFIRVEI